MQLICEVTDNIKYKRYNIKRILPEGSCIIEFITWRYITPRGEVMTNCLSDVRVYIHVVWFYRIDKRVMGFTNDFVGPFGPHALKWQGHSRTPDCRSCKKVHFIFKKFLIFYIYLPSAARNS